MNTDAIATRMSVLTRALPTRILLMGEAGPELEGLRGQLEAAGFEVTHALDGEAALAHTEQRWFPVVIADWDAPGMSGVRFCELLRRRGVSDTYVILRAGRAANADYDRGYAAGADDYLTWRPEDAELTARINAAFSTLALRRSLQEARAALQCTTPIDAESGVYAPTELQVRLQAELHRAQRYRRPLAVMTVGVHAGAAPPPATTLREVAAAIGAAIRAHVDWIGRVAGPQAVFAVVLPEATAVDGVQIRRRFVGALTALRSREPSLTFSFGVCALEGANVATARPDADALLGVAERCRGCAGRIGAEQLEAVRESVTRQVAIPCRQGYAVDQLCPLYSRRAPTPERASVE